MQNKQTNICHFYCIDHCKKGSSCHFAHPIPRPFACLNGIHCPIPHNTIKCPYLANNISCPTENCEYNHQLYLEKKNSSKYSPQKQLSEIEIENKPINNKNIQLQTPISTFYQQKQEQGQGQEGLQQQQQLQQSQLATKQQQCEQQDQQQQLQNKYLDENIDQKSYSDSQDLKQIYSKSQNNTIIGEKQMSLEEKKIQEQSEQSFFQEDINKKFEQRLAEINQDLDIFKPYKQKLKKQISVNLDLLFIMDCTASMGIWIKQCKKELKSIIDQVKEEHNGVKVRIGFIGYRDFSEKGYEFSIIDFQEDVDIVTSFIQETLALGGGDIPEDLTGALEQAKNLSWKNKAKFAIIVADAPCHGREFYNVQDIQYENHPNGDPNGRNPLQLIKDLGRIGVTFYAVKINNLTNKMYTLFSKALFDETRKNFQIADLGNSINLFGFYVVQSVLNTISSSMVGSEANIMRNAVQLLREIRMKQNATQQQINFARQSVVEILQKSDDEQFQQVLDKEEKKHEVDELKLMISSDPPNWENLQQSFIYESVCHTFFIVKDKGVKINWKKPLLQNSQIKTRIRICETPFSQGAMRYAFHALDELLIQKLVAKVPKIVSKDYNIDTLKKDLEVMYICQHLVNEFNEKVIPYVPDANLLLNFVHCFIYEVLDQKCKFKFFQVENYIDGNYEKYNNNAGWIKQSVSHSSYISQAFSHYSWQISEGYMMVVDLQGVNGVLTDPQIHCIDYRRFGKGNLGYEGILKFFFSHECNVYCKELGLIHPGEFGAFPPGFDINALSKPQRFKEVNQDINTLCDLCRLPFKIKVATIKYKFDNNQEKYCKECDEKRQTSMKIGNCIDCSTTFKSSAYWFLMKRTDFPVRCGGCRRDRRDKMRMELENE